MLPAITSLMSGYKRDWWVAGGWAIDLYLDEVSRPHGDIDVAVLRAHQDDLYSYIANWSPRKVVNGDVRPWQSGERLELPVHEVWAFPNGERLEFLFNEAAGDRWIFRRNASVSTPLSSLTLRSRLGVPFLCPEVVLLFKAKQPSTQDQDDFARVRPKLQKHAREWLISALELCHPGHEWRAAL